MFHFFATKAAIIFSLPGSIFFAAILGGAVLWGNTTGTLIISGGLCWRYLVDVNNTREYQFGPTRPCLYTANALSPDYRYFANIEDYAISIGFIDGGLRGREVSRFSINSAGNSALTWSPDQKHLAFVSNISDRRLWELFVVNTDGTNLRSLGILWLSAPWLAWSPNAQRIAFASNKDGDDELYLINTQTGQRHRLTDNNFRDSLPSWSPDGRQLVFTSTEDGFNELHIMDVSTGERYQLTRGAYGYAPAWSPDGRRIAFFSNRNRYNAIYIINADGTDQHQLTFAQLLLVFRPHWVGR